MENIRGLKCLTNRRNTGLQGCSFIPKHKRGCFLVPYDFSVTVNDNMTDDAVVAAILAALDAALLNDNPALRAYFIGGFVGFEDKSEAENMQKFGFGTSQPTNRGKIMHEYQIDPQKGFGYFAALHTFDLQHEDFKIVTIDTTRIYGCNKKSNGVLVAFQGQELDLLHVPDMKEPNYTEAVKYVLSLGYANNEELNEELFAVDMGQNMLTYGKAHTISDVLLTGSFSATRVLKLKARTVIGGVNMGTLYGTELEDSTLYTFNNKLSGVAVAVTSNAYDPITGIWTITLTAGSGYVATQTLVVKYVAPSALVAGDVGYYESNTMEIVMT